MLGMGGDKARTSRPTQSVETLIGGQVEFRGDISFSGGLYVEGKVYGSIIATEGSSAVLTIAEGGLVEGEVRAPVVAISGELRGDVYAGERIELASSARVEGNIHYKVVEMAAGSMLTGRLIHAEAPLRQITGPTPVDEAKPPKVAKA